MPNSIGPTGLVTMTRAELLTYYTTAFQTIYGADINLDSDTPDGQLINILIQSVLDLQDLLTTIYNGFDPDSAVGNVLDQRVAINGIQRQAGTFTTTNITLINSQSVNLFGVDQTVQDIYTVSDLSGNQWQLQSTVLGVAPGTHNYLFQSAVPGAVLTIPNTITIPVTVVLGVDSINNPTALSILGLNEESDAALRLRRQKSVTLSSQGYLSGLLAALENIPGVTFAFVEENNTATTNGDGVPGHSIWVIVAGSGANADIANAIYTKRNAGCGMFGMVSFAITQVDGTTFTVFWDVVAPVNLFIRFTATSLDGVNPPNIAAIRTQLPSLFTPGVAEQVNINDLATLVQEIDPNTLVTSAGFSLSASGSFTTTLTPALKSNQFAISSPDIIILNMIMIPASATVAHGTTKTFQAQGGFGAITYTISTNNSGGTINSSTGLYTAGATHPVTDTITATDTQSHTVTASVSVT